MPDTDHDDDNVVLPFAGATAINIPPAPPLIRLAAGERPEITLAAIDALHTAQAPFYRRNNKIVFVAKIPAKASDDSPIEVPGIEPVMLHHLLHELGKAARFEKYDGRSKKWLVTDAPDDIAKRIMALPNEWRFPPLNGIIGTPTMRPDGSLLTAPGYDPQTGYVLFDPPDMPAIPEHPTRQDALACLGLLKELLIEFPITNEVSRAVALSQFMTPVLRPALGDAVPLHSGKAPASGSGKSYLMDCSAMIAIGERCPVISFTKHNEEENEKRLHGAATSGQPIIGIDNCNGLLRGGHFLQQLIERPRLQIRKLGGTPLTGIPNSYSVFANGNNIEYSADTVRRVVQYGLDANQEDPYRRRFKYNPVAMVAKDRGIYVMVILTIVRAYLAAGCPDLPPPFMSFEPWSRLVRGSLMWLGCADPVASVDILASEDFDYEIRGAIFEALARLPEINDGYTVAGLIDEAKVDDLLRMALGKVARDKDGLDDNKLGQWLRWNRDRLADNWKLVKRDGRHSKWALRHDSY